MATFNGNRLNNNIDGTQDDDIINGLGGNDVLRGRGGNDQIFGGADNDTLEGGAGDDLLDGGEGVDFIRYTDAFVAVTIDLALGVAERSGLDRDTLVAIENAIGSNRNDTILGDDDANELRGLRGDDQLFGRGGNDLLLGGPGNDILNGENGLDDLRGEGGDDILRGGVSSDRLDGGPGDDQLSGGTSGDELLGGSGNDDLQGDNGSDVLEGGSGDDLLSGGSGRDNLFGGGGTDELRGDDDDDRLFGGADNDRLIGGEGDDQLDGGLGDDILNGGPGQGDRVVYFDQEIRVEIDLAAGTARRGSEQDTLLSIEEAEGSIADDDLRGSAQDNYLFGFDGNDVLIGRDGRDRLDGGEGDDELFGGPGGDNLDGGGGNDVLDGGPGPDFLFGSDGDDILRGGAGDDTLSAGGGRDQLIGGEGDDRFFGNSFSQIDGGPGQDLLDYSFSADMDQRVDLALGTTTRFSDGVIVDRFTSIENIAGSEGGRNELLGDDNANEILGGLFADTFIDGRGGNDQLRGQRGNDVIRGGEGNDVLIGGEGNDILTGGPGADIAVLSGARSDYTFALADPIVNGGPNGVGGSDPRYVHATRVDGSSVDLINLSTEFISFSEGLIADRFIATQELVAIPEDPIPDMDTPEPQVVVRWNAGDTTVSAVDGGLDWVPDLAVVVDGIPRIGANSVITQFTQNVPYMPDAATTPIGLYSQEIFGGGRAGDNDLSIDFDVSASGPGFYLVRLFMGNAFNGTDDPGERLFSVRVEGEDVFPSLDIVESLDHQRGGVFQWTGAITDDVVDIALNALVQNPLINAVEVIKLSDDLPGAVLSIAPLNADRAEGNSGSTPFTFEVSRSGDLGTAVSVDYRVTGDALPGAPAQPGDFVGGRLPAGSITFDPGQVSTVLTIDITGETNAGPDEFFRVTLFNARNAVLSDDRDAFGAIRDDDSVRTSAFEGGLDLASLSMAAPASTPETGPEVPAAWDREALSDLGHAYQDAEWSLA